MNRHVTISAFGLCSLLLLTNFCTAEDKKTTLNSADEQFIKHEAGAGMALEKIADYGVKKASKNDIKSFAERVLTDHIKANKELAKLAASKGVETSTVIDPKHAETYAMLESLSGTGFDKGFLATIVSVHTKCVNSFEEAAEDAKDSDLQAWAQKMLPTLKIHLEKAKALSGGTGNRAKNMRDRDSRTLTPLDQGSSKSDTEITAQIRKDIIAGHDMSLNGKNIKIITLNGLVTLRGAVNSSEEKSKITDIARRQVGEHNLNNQLEVK